MWNARKTNPFDTYFEGELFEPGVRTEDKQELHTMVRPTWCFPRACFSVLSLFGQDAVKYLEVELKEVLVSLARNLFGESESQNFIFLRQNKGCKIKNCQT